MDIILRTTIPIILLIGLGFLSRRMGVFKAGDEKILSGYVYYFALPSLFFINLSETVFNKATLTYIVGCSIPVFIIIAFFVLLYIVFRFSKDLLFLLIISSAFGSYAFFGIPFIMFAFPTPEGEFLAALSSGTISLVGIVVSLSILEIHSLKSKGLKSVKEGMRHVLKRLSANPLIISIFLGVVTSVSKFNLPLPIARPIRMLGNSTAAVAIFMLGVFFYGRQYGHFGKALGLSMLRIMLLPAIAFVTISFMEVSEMQRSVVVLMNAMPLAISLAVLSERYNFYKETIATIVLITSLSAGLYLNIWLAILGYH